MDKTNIELELESEEEEEEIEEGWDDWKSEDSGEDSVINFLCLFCTEEFDSAESLFEHCALNHRFDFNAIVTDLGLDFYGSLKLINYVRSKVAENKCWSCDQSFECNKDLKNHLHVTTNYKKINGKLHWDDDCYLKPYLQDDPLLHSLSIDDDDDHDEQEEAGFSLVGQTEPNLDNLGDQFAKITSDANEDKGLIRVANANSVAREIKSVDDYYFGSYSCFSIHREMLSDKVRMEAYRNALLNNPSLMKQAAVLDVGCGTGILSLFAAKAGASRVVAVEASSKMASIATQIARDNGLLADGDTSESKVITVVNSKVEEIEEHLQIGPRKFDVLVSEWMGYCLLYESMLSSVIFARDRFLKPGGAILPDIATIFGAGFGKGGTSLPFWENVYGFNMCCIGKELAQDSARVPIVDSVDPKDIVTDSVLIHSFDLATMGQNEMDFTATFDLMPKTHPAATSACPTSADPTWCYGLVLWFETSFTTQFCTEYPAVLSTSPYGPRTHWAQTILTFREPIAVGERTGESVISRGGAVGSAECPAVRVRSRISIARAQSHRSIDVSVEATGIGSDGRKKSWPVQIFNL